MTRHSTSTTRRVGTAALPVLMGLILSVGASAQQASSGAAAAPASEPGPANAGATTPGSGQDAMLQRLIEMAPYDGYLAAHRDVQDPPQLLGGPVSRSP